MEKKIPEGNKEVPLMKGFSNFMKKPSEASKIKTSKPEEKISTN